ncbi:hypothetical protein ETD83_21940 [Actinomadura soli]|uniref:Uncharacterized protein n=1 Tax=Actinomadura soli TaxID=2508997 RepID=A0A5C4JB34_9ACTN|nr:hypothetical protein [Actinomadura soli]TMQ95903.1 hypothetical protein ETD83_21940 [Actinomadura soli]
MTDFSDIEVGDEHIELLRRFLSDDPNDPSTFDVSTAESNAIAHNLMAYSAFAVAVLRKFSPNFTIPEVIRYVTDLRKAILRENALQINPRVAEGMIRAVLEDQTLKDREPYGADNEAMVNAGFAVLLELFHGAELKGPELDEFLRESADYARRWLAVQQARQAREEASAG